MKPGTHRLSIEFVGEGPPREFRIFKAGINATTKGDFLFDDEAAEKVMAAAKRHGTDRNLMIDLEHLSLEPESKRGSDHSQRAGPPLP